MKLTKETLKQIIKEETEAVMNEAVTMPIIPIKIPEEMRHRINKAMHSGTDKGHEFAKKMLIKHGFQDVADKFDKYLESK